MTTLGLRYSQSPPCLEASIPLDSFFKNDRNYASRLIETALGSLDDAAGSIHN